ncbi:MAG: TrmB family transcriptional regulator [Anaerolineae bacterium]|nr:TrmB family transcriptional regulator [Anaerolineae bacterium]
MRRDLIDQLVALGFSEYEAKAYLALLRESPVTGYQLAKISGVPRSMIYEVLGKLVTRGAAMTLRKEGSVEYAPVPADEFLDTLHREHEERVNVLKDALAHLAAVPNPEYVWNIEGYDNILAKAEEMIRQAQKIIYLSLMPEAFVELAPALRAALARGVRVVMYTAGDLELPGAQVIATLPSEEAASRVERLGLILVIDEQEVLIGECLAGFQARASWTGNPLFVFIAEHHLRTDPYLPQILACLGQRAAEIIREEDRELFARAMERRVGTSGE